MLGHVYFSYYIHGIYLEYSRARAKKWLHEEENKGKAREKNERVT